MLECLPSRSPIHPQPQQHSYEAKSAHMMVHASGRRVGHNQLRYAWIIDAFDVDGTFDASKPSPDEQTQPTGETEASH